MNSTTKMFNERWQKSATVASNLKVLIENLRWLRDQSFDAKKEEELTSRIEILLSAYVIANKIDSECHQIYEYNTDHSW